ncbi:hypothetical protein ABEP16_13140 [Priestia aryabhattai]|uniref:hypothetical protein n=1 Tax=Priestia aryabhattai TaxID=412384 RepID=UPI003D28414F
MSKKLVALSFFKSNKIHYYLENSLIFFPCFKCHQKAIMNSKDTLWNCESCNEQGTLKYLINFTQQNSLENIKKYKIYNPRKKRKEIYKQFSSLKEQCDIKTKNELEYLQKEIDELLIFLLKNR